MTAKDAYTILSKKLPLMKIRSCLDFGTFYAFSLAPIYVEDADNYVTGTVMQAIDKETGELFDYDITSDYEAYIQSKEIGIDTIYDTPIA